MEERKTLCKEEFNNCEIVKENKQLQDKLKKIEEYIEPFIIDDELDHDCCEEEKHYVAMELLEIIKEEKKESDK
jgi:hypothetical protein